MTGVVTGVNMAACNIIPYNNKLHLVWLMFWRAIRHPLTPDLYIQKVNIDNDKFNISREDM